MVNDVLDGIRSGGVTGAKRNLIKSDRSLFFLNLLLLAYSGNSLKLIQTTFKIDPTSLDLKTPSLTLNPFLALYYKEV